jgi:aldose 1-epimerase
VEIFGPLPGNREAGLYTLVNRHGLRARVTNFGAILLSIEVPDRQGELAPVTLGYKSLQGWVEDPYYFGASVGRFGNRIRAGKFTLQGKSYSLPLNNEPGGIPCHLHGGPGGFHKQQWDASPSSDGQAITFTRTSPDGEEGYPGNLVAKITYTLTDDNELIWEAEAITVAPTPVNLLHHSYWNLSGDEKHSVLDHELLLEADAFLEIDCGMIPTGEIQSVHETPMDFTFPRIIGEACDAKYPALRATGGYDHCWVVRGEQLKLRRAARLHHPNSGRVMEVFSNQPGIQFFVLDSDDTPFSGLCLETQHFPDSPNQPSFPNTILQPGELYRHVMIHRFSVQE